MYYKVIKNGKVIDVLNKLVFLKYGEKHKRMFLCEEEDAQAFLSSDGNHVWHEKSLHKIPVDGYDNVDLVEIDVYEYNQLKCLNCKTPEEILEEYTLLLFQEGIL